MVRLANRTVFANYRAVAKSMKEVYIGNEKKNTVYSINGSSEALCGEECGFGSLTEAPLEPLNSMCCRLNPASFNGCNSHKSMHIRRQGIKL